MIRGQISMVITKLENLVNPLSFLHQMIFNTYHILVELHFRRMIFWKHKSNREISIGEHDRETFDVLFEMPRGRWNLESRGNSVKVRCNRNVTDSAGPISLAWSYRKFSEWKSNKNCKFVFSLWLSRCKICSSSHGGKQHIVPFKRFLASSHLNHGPLESVKRELVYPLSLAILDLKERTRLINVAKSQFSTNFPSDCFLFKSWNKNSRHYQEQSVACSLYHSLHRSSGWLCDTFVREKRVFEFGPCGPLTPLSFRDGKRGENWWNQIHASFKLWIRSNSQKRRKI